MTSPMAEAKHTWTRSVLNLNGPLRWHREQIPWSMAIDRHFKILLTKIKSARIHIKYYNYNLLYTCLCLLWSKLYDVNYKQYKLIDLTGPSRIKKYQKHLSHAWLLPGVDDGLPTAVGPSWKVWKLRPVAALALWTGALVADVPVFMTLARASGIKFWNFDWQSTGASWKKNTEVVQSVRVTAEKSGSEASWPLTRAWCNLQVCAASHTASTTFSEDEEWLFINDQTLRDSFRDFEHVHSVHSNIKTNWG